MTANDPESHEDRRRTVTRRLLLAAGVLGFGRSVAGLLRTDVSHRDRPPWADATPEPRTDDETMTDEIRPTTYVGPGEVQNAIDSAAGSPNARVRLEPETVYEPAQPWQVKSGVTLAYNGAILEPTQDVDLHHVHPGGCVLDPFVDLRQVSPQFTSSVFTFDSKQYGFYGNNPTWHVRGGLTRGQNGEGTLYEFRQGDTNSIYFVHADHAVRDVGTVVDMHREDAWGINGNRIYGLWYGFDVGIRMRNRTEPSRLTDNISGNEFDVIAQPDDSEILWDLEVGKFNVLRGRLWDFSNYSDVVWRLHGEGAEERYGNIFRWFPVGGTQAHLVEDVGPQVIDDRVGDQRNRIVVPWTQGRPVGDFTG